MPEELESESEELESEELESEELESESEELEEPEELVELVLEELEELVLEEPEELELEESDELEELESFFFFLSLLRVGTLSNCSTGVTLLLLSVEEVTSLAPVVVLSSEALARVAARRIAATERFFNILCRLGSLSWDTAPFYTAVPVPLN